MPKKVLPTQEDFLNFSIQMNALGFKKVSTKQFQNDLYRLDLQPPRHKEGREVGFEYFANNLRVKVWTTFVEEWGEARSEDLGWVLITKNDKALYFAHPMRRTKNFFVNLLSYAKACKERIEHRPCCPEKTCRRMFVIKKTKHGGVYWACSNTELHGVKVPRASWDHGLSPESIAFMKVERAEAKRYREKRIENWQSVGQAKVIRKKWIIKNPNNLE